MFWITCVHTFFLGGYSLDTAASAEAFLHSVRTAKQRWQHVTYRWDWAALPEGVALSLAAELK